MGRSFPSVLSWLLAGLPYVGAMAWGGLLGGWGGSLEAPLGIVLSPWLFVSIYVTFFGAYPVWAAALFPLLYLAAFAGMAASIKQLAAMVGKGAAGLELFRSWLGLCASDIECDLNDCLLDRLEGMLF